MLLVFFMLSPLAILALILFARHIDPQTGRFIDKEYVTHVGEAVLRRVDRGEWHEAAFRQMMDEALSRPVDRALFDLE
jgi:hypothetical protein